MPCRLVARCLAALLIGITITSAAVYPAAAAQTTRTAATAHMAPAVLTSGSRVQCTTTVSRYKTLAQRMTRDIARRLSGRLSSVGLEETDSRTGITCQYNASKHFYAASAIKVTILAALLRKAQEQHRYLTSREAHLAWLMITQSDNDAAEALWEDVGIPSVQHFLNLAGMTQTRLAYAWGLSLLTARDETKLLTVLSTVNSILNKASRVYERHLMASVIPSQRWGVPSGAPRGVTVHVKNGWLPYPGSTWEINSLGIFTAPHRTYLMAVLTYNNPSMIYGINTIQGAAQVMHHDLNTVPSE